MTTDPAARPAPYLVLVDDREKRPYAFAQPLKRDRRTWVQLRTETRRLETGDYTIAGCEAAVCVERKSVADLYNTLGQGRRRFVNELERLDKIATAILLVEGELGTIIGSPPRRSRMNPIAIYQSILAWTVRYSRVRWFFCPGREFAEVTAARLLDWWWREHNRQQEAA